MQENTTGNRKNTLLKMSKPVHSKLQKDILKIIMRLVMNPISANPRGKSGTWRIPGDVISAFIRQFFSQF